MAHFRAQLTLLPSSQPIVPSTRLTLKASGRQVAARVTPREPVIPGGPAVHADVTLLEDGHNYFPAGAQFEICSPARIGYGSVLALLAS